MRGQLSAKRCSRPSLGASAPAVPRGEKAAFRRALGGRCGLLESSETYGECRGGRRAPLGMAFRKRKQAQYLLGDQCAPDLV